MKKNEENSWKVIGQVLATLVSLFTIIRDTFAEMKVGIEILAWVVADGKDYFVEKVLRPLGEEYQRRQFPTTLTLGLYATADAYRAAFDSAGMRVSDWANDLMNKMSIATSQCTVDLVIVSVAELGFTKATRFDLVIAKAKELGYELCPAEVGPALRLAYAGQALGEYLFIAMEALAGSGGYLGVFCVERGAGGLWLGASCGYPERLYRPERRLVLVRRQASKQ